MILILGLLYLGSTMAKLEVVDLDRNEGYLPIKIGEEKLVNHYIKVLHIINITELEVAKSKIGENMKLLSKTLPSDSINDSSYKTLARNYKELESKLKTIMPRNRNKRGLINLVGKTLKFIAGTMDSEDEEMIINSLQNLNSDTTHLIEENNKQVKINKELQLQIENLKSNILNQRRYISSHIQNLVFNTQIKDNFYYMKIIFQIHNDINSLLHFVDTIEDVILTSRLGILTKNILTDEESELIRSNDEFKEIRIASLTFEETVILTLLIPRFSPNIFEKYILEPLLNEKNESLLLSHYEIILDDKNNIYKPQPKERKVKNLVTIYDKCIEDIFNSLNLNNCTPIKKEPKEIIKELGFGLVIVKNLKRIELKQNCNNNIIYIEGTKILKFENCSININNQLYVNNNKVIINHHIHPGYTKKMENKNEVQEELSLNIVNLKNLENRKLIEKSNNQISYNNTLLYITMFIILTIAIVIIIRVVKKLLIKNAPRTEALTNGGEVIDPPQYIIHPNV